MATTGCLLAGFTVAVWLRTAIGGPAVASSARAGLAFAAVLLVLAITAGSPVRPVSRLPTARTAGWGVFGAAVLCVPPLLLNGISAPSAGPYLPWAVVVGVVAVAEEAFLRGVLFDAVKACAGEPGGSADHGGTRATGAAITVTALCFAGLHVPLYGWHAFPLDLAVGLWLGALRQAAGDWTAPAITHVLADLAGWWLR
jgi:hypothetical protein